MAGFWYPYADFNEARARLTAFANATVGPQCGISFCDGGSIGVVRQPSGTADTWLWLNVLTQHVAAPPPPPPKPRGTWGKIKAWFWHAMEIQGEAQLQQAQAELAMGQAIDSAIEKHIWLPVHDFLLRHKLLADGVGVALDVVGVVAGVVFIVAALPEIAGGAVVVGTLGLVTGVAAAAGSLVLLGVDGTVFGLEVSGNEALRNAQAARDRVARIANPEKHPGPVNRRMRKVAAFERATEAQAKAAQAAHDRILITALRDLGIVPGATLGSTGLLAGAPPDVALSAEQREADEKYRRMLAPEGGMPKDVKMEMRVSAHEKVQAP